MKKLLLFLFFFPWLLLAQKHDNNWLFGYGENTNEPIWGDTRMEFNDIQVPTIFAEEFDMHFANTSTVFSDDEGELLFYSNGIFVADYEHEMVENSFGLNPGPDFSFFENSGYRVDQGILTLPYPEHENEFILLHSDMIIIGNEYNYYTSKLRYTHLRLNELTGNITLEEKNIILNEGIFEAGKLTACKHANGRDWWIIQSDFPDGKYFIYLLSPSGIQLNSEQIIGPSIHTGLGQALFSPDGLKFIRFQGYDIYEDFDFLVMDFDRCTGEFSNPIHEGTSHNNALCAGGAVSPSSQYFYATAFDVVYQYDLWAENILDSRVTVAEYDGYISPWIGTLFKLGQLAPDGKIYIGTYGTNDVLHVIHNPDRPGVACNFEQHGVQLPTMNFATIPNNPNYRLGPLDGSSCDTLGLDNIPVCDFRYARDTLSAKTIEFTDVSHYQPQDWYWTFGDGGTSTEEDPVHQYQSGGTYEVCVTISNEYGSDSKCRTIQIITTNTQELWEQQTIKSLPNPATHFVYLQLERALPQGARWQLTNLQGRVMQEERVAGNQRQRIDLADVPAGVYFQSIILKDEIVWRERTVVIK